MSENQQELKQTIAPVKPSHKGRYKKLLGGLLSLTVFGLALFFLHNELNSIQPAAIAKQIYAIPKINIFLAIVFATCGYLTLTGYDALAMRYIKRDVPYRKTAVTAFMAYAVGHNVGMAALSGGSIRYRMYSLLGLSASEIAQIIAFVTLTFALGASLLLGIAIFTLPNSETAILKLSAFQLDLIASFLIALPIIYLLLTKFYPQPVTVRHWKIAIPSTSIGLKQIVLATIDLSFAAATLYILLAPELNMSFFSFLGIYLIAIAAGIISSVPGGIGVIEAVLLAALPQVDRSVLLGTIIVYRLIYYIAPLCIALLMLTISEIRLRGKTIKGAAEKTEHLITSLAPSVIAIAVFLAGVVLLVSGSMPAVESRLSFISKGLPLPLMELSHLAGSVFGVGLLIIARGLQRRLHGAYLAALMLLVLGILSALFKGLDYEEAIILGVILVFLFASRDEFYRQESLRTQNLSKSWIFSIIAVLAIVLWVGLINYRNVAYSDQLWWKFAFQADAPRSMRAFIVVAISVLIFSLSKAIRLKSIPTAFTFDTDSSELQTALTEYALDPSANAALMGDKYFLWSKDRTGFLMYGISGDSWIALGDPIGPLNVHKELVWAFRELVDQHDGRTVFYQISSESLALYVDMGLAVAKLGEEARINLTDFTLEGSKRAEFRQAVNKAKRNGASFEIIKKEELANYLPELRVISDNWLNDKSASEKSFSLGAFSDEYISKFDCAIVKANGATVAFANLWTAPNSKELSVDLMRYSTDAPKGIMDYLFVELMLWGKEHNYQSFSLGMAPLSGLEERSLAPMWHKIGHLIFSHGEKLYNFEGLRSYKGKFDPEWLPKYIAYSGKMVSLPKALFDTSKLISGGLLKSVSK